MIAERGRPQVAWPMRGLWFLIVGWWASGIWMVLALLISLTEIGLPLAILMITFHRIALPGSPISGVAPLSGGSRLCAR